MAFSFPGPPPGASSNQTAHHHDFALADVCGWTLEIGSVLARRRAAKTRGRSGQPRPPEPLLSWGASVPDLWYYSHDEHKIGPYSGRQLKDLADSGEILPTDTVWKEGIEKDRKSTRLNSSHLGISYAVFCLKKKKTQ